MLAENSSISSPDVTLKDLLKQKSVSLPKLQITPDDSTAEQEHVSFNKCLSAFFLCFAFLSYSFLQKRFQFILWNIEISLYVDYFKYCWNWKGLRLSSLPMLFALLALHKLTFCWKPF